MAEEHRSQSTPASSDEPLLREPVSARSRVVRRADVTVDQSADGWALIDGLTGERIALSPAAAQLWSQLDGVQTVGDIADQLGFPLLDVIDLIRRLRASSLAGDAPADER